MVFVGFSYVVVSSSEPASRSERPSKNHKNRASGGSKIDPRATKIDQGSEVFGVLGSESGQERSKSVQEWPKRRLKAPKSAPRGQLRPSKAKTILHMVQRFFGSGGVGTLAEADGGGGGGKPPGFGRFSD